MEFQQIRLESIDSTNDEASRLVNASNIDRPTVIYAMRQTAGRGTRGRSWDSETGNIHASFVFRLDEKRHQRPWLLVYPLALAVRDFVVNCVGEKRVELKWPNDVLVEGRKASGSLHETSKIQNASYFIAGIGVNLKWKPETALFNPCCLGEFTDDLPSVDVAVARLASTVARRIDDWNSEAFEATRREYLAFAYRLNEEIQISLRTDKASAHTGIFRGIDDNGALILEMEGRTAFFTAGDVFPGLK